MSYEQDQDEYNRAYVDTDEQNGVNDFGFRWGQVLVERLASIHRRKDDAHSWKIIRITPDTGKTVEVYISPTGRSIRIYKGHKEMK